MASYQVAAPEPFNFSRPSEWEKWICRFDRFRLASGIHKKEEASQVNTLIYSMGDRADDILQSFRLTDEDSKKYKTVKEKFDSYFVKRHNTIFEQARFNLRKQEQGESVDTFITALYELVEHCSYGQLHDEMIRDRIVVGIRDSNLSEKLQLDDKLTLETAIQHVHQSETIKQQQPLLREEQQSGNMDDVPIGSIRKRAVVSKSPHTRNVDYSPQQTNTMTRSCTYCGKSPAHVRKYCAA